MLKAIQQGFCYYRLPSIYMSMPPHALHHGHDHGHAHAHQPFSELDASAPDLPTHPQAQAIATAVADAVRGATALDKETTSVLDFACGSGHVSRQLVQDVAAVVGVDISETGVANYNHFAAQHGVAHNMRAVRLDVAEDLGELRGRQFDVAVCANAFHHIADPGLITQILASLLKPAGTLLVVDVAHDSLALPPAMHPLAHITGAHVHHSQGFAPERIQEMFARAGLGTFESGVLDEFDMPGGAKWKLFVATGVKPEA